MSLKRSPDYRAIRSRVTNPQALDSWRAADFHYFLFQLRHANGDAANADDAPVALFVMSYEYSLPVSVLVVTPHLDKKEAEVINLREPAKVLTVPLEET